MRIIGGHFRGRVLQSPDGRGTRPTDARAREMLFNILGEFVLEARVLDLYAGSGSVGIEALSRGASSCVFIEQNAGACRVIKSNLKSLKVEGDTQVWHTNVKGALRKLGADGARFDLMFADPPFDNPRELSDLCKALDTAAPLLHNEPGRNPAPSFTSNFSPFDPSETEFPVPEVLGESTAEEEAAPDAPADLEPPGNPEPLLIIQHHRKQAPLLSAPWRLRREKRAGESTLSFFVLDKPLSSEEEASVLDTVSLP